jgi:hypothetical protein
MAPERTLASAKANPAARQMMCDVIGDLITNERQRKQLVLDDRIVGLLVKVSIGPLGLAHSPANHLCRTQYR